MFFFFATTNLSKGHCHQIYLQQWKQDRKNNFSHMFSLLQVLTKKEQDISNHSYTALKKLLACLKWLITLHFYVSVTCQFLCSLVNWAWSYCLALKGWGTCLRTSSWKFFEPWFFYQSLKLVSFCMSLINPLSPLPRGLDPKYNYYILPRPLGSRDRGFINLRQY